MKNFTDEQARKNAKLNAQDVTVCITTDDVYFDAEEFLIALYDVDDFGGFVLVKDGNSIVKATGGVFVVPSNMITTKVTNDGSTRYYFKDTDITRYLKSEYFDIDNSYGYSYTVYLLGELAMKTNAMVNPELVYYLQIKFSCIKPKKKEYLYKLKDGLLSCYDNISLILPKSVNVEICKSYNDIYKCGTLVEQKLTSVVIHSDKELYFGDSFIFIGEAEVD